MCDLGGYGENCNTVAGGYDPHWDFDVIYWADQAKAGVLDSADMLRSMLWWIWTMLSGISQNVNADTQMVFGNMLRGLSVRAGDNAFGQFWAMILTLAGWFLGVSEYGGLIR